MEINDALRQSRGLTNKSQEYMALELGIARKTVQNWERGVSDPTIKQAIEWFRALGISPIPYLFQVVHVDMERISSSDDEERLRKSLHNMIDALPEEGMRQLLYLFYGEHGSSPRAILNMVTAHLQSPMESRVTHGVVIAKDYEMAKRRGNLTDINHIQPDMDYFMEAISRAEEAAVTDSDAYIMGEKFNY